MDAREEVPRTVGLRLRAVVIAVAVFASLLAGAGAGAAVRQNDAGTRRDAGNSFESATKIKPHGFYAGELADGDADDFYKFSLKQGAAMSVLVEFGGGTLSDPVTLLDPNGVPIDVGTKIAGNGVTISSAFTGEFPAVRLAVHKALEAGEYRLHLQAKQSTIRDYALCFLNCEGIVKAPQDFFALGALPTPFTKVLLIPPTHGDLGNPLGPTVLDYVDATLRGVRKWNDAIKAFTKDFPRYSYLRKMKIHVDIFDGVHPVDPALYDVIIGYAAAGPAFRGVAADVDQRNIEQLIADAGLESTARFTGRGIILSLFGSSPRVGQVLYDFPEVMDLEIVTTHEFGHTFGLGHTRWWDPKLGPDLMNSPATFIYGDGFPLGDGGERTKRKCLSTVNLYGLAVAYRWIPSGKWVPTERSVNLPRGMPYKWYC